MTLAHILDRFRRAPQRLPPPDAYAIWAETYPPWAHNPLMEAEQAVVAPLVRMLAPARAIDVGTGTGRCLRLLEAAGVRSLVGLDRSWPMLTRWRGAAPLVCADACRLPFRDACVDLVCASLMAGDLEDLRSWVAEAARILEPGGHLVYSDFHPEWSARRWRRTFTAADGRRLELPYYPHAIADHLAALHAAGIAVHAIREPRAAGRGAPVVVVFHGIRPGHRDGGRTGRRPC